MGSGYGSGRLANRGRSGGVRRRSVAVGRRAAGARGASLVLDLSKHNSTDKAPRKSRCFSIG